MIDWKKMLNKEFWSKHEIAYQYVHFTNALFIALFVSLLLAGRWYAALSGIATGLCVEAYQWIRGNHKQEDAIRDLVFWALGGIVGYCLY